MPKHVVPSGRIPGPIVETSHVHRSHAVHGSHDCEEVVLSFGRRTQIYADLTCLHLFTWNLSSNPRICKQEGKYMSGIQCRGTSTVHRPRVVEDQISLSQSHLPMGYAKGLQHFTGSGHGFNLGPTKNGASSAPSTDSLPVMWEPRNQMKSDEIRFKTHLKAHQKHTSRQRFSSQISLTVLWEQFIAKVLWVQESDPKALRGVPLCWCQAKHASDPCWVGCPSVRLDELPCTLLLLVATPRHCCKFFIKRAEMRN